MASVTWGEEIDYREGVQRITRLVYVFSSYKCCSGSVALAVHFGSALTSCSLPPSSPREQKDMDMGRTGKEARDGERLGMWCMEGLGIGTGGGAIHGAMLIVMDGIVRWMMEKIVPLIKMGRDGKMKGGIG